jgi:hypothetical protein
MDALVPLFMFGLALFGMVAAAAGHESRDGFEHRDSDPYRRY